MKPHKHRGPPAVDDSNCSFRKRAEEWPMTLGDFTQRIGGAMRLHRKRLGISQEAFADRIGMRRAYYGAVERGHKNFQLRTLQRVASGLGMRTSKLIEIAETELALTEGSPPLDLFIGATVARSASIGRK